MSSMNKCFLIGNLGVEVEMKYVGDTALATFSIATKRRMGKGKPDETDWHRVQAWGKTAENCSKYIGKGSQVMVEGEIRPQTYTKKDGTKGFSVTINAQNVTFLDSKKDREAGAGAHGHQVDDLPDYYEQSNSLHDVPF